MHRACLDARLRPVGLDGVGQAHEAVADEREDVVYAAVLDLGEEVRPVLGALAAAVTGPLRGCAAGSRP